MLAAGTSSYENPICTDRARDTAVRIVTMGETYPKIGICRNLVSCLVIIVGQAVATPFNIEHLAILYLLFFGSGVNGIWSTCTTGEDDQLRLSAGFSLPRLLNDPGARCGLVF